MPELPDLQVFSVNLDKKLAGKILKKVTVLNTKKLTVPVSKLKNFLEKQLLKKVYREGKELRFEFKNGNILGLHLMLRGQLYLFKEKNEKKNSIIELLFNDDTGLALIDFMGQAIPTLNPQHRDAPDALASEVNTKFLKDELSKRKTNIKSFLLDQNIIRGIGSAYADEILWAAAISPFSITNKLPATKIALLAKSIKSVLRNAEKQIIKSNPDLISGEVRDFLKIHNSKKTQSPTGASIQYKKSGLSKTYFTEEQQLFN